MKVKIHAEQTIQYAAEIDYDELKQIAPGLPSKEEIRGQVTISAGDGEWVTALMEEFVAEQGYETDSTGMTVTEIGQL